MFTPAVFLLISLPLWPAPQVQPPAAHTRESALQAVADGDYARAEGLLHTLVAGDPKNTDFLMDLARTQRQLDKVDQALETIARLLKIDPHNLPGTILLARISADGNDWDTVVMLLDPLATPEASYDISQLLAEAYRRLEQPVEAAWYYEQAIRSNPVVLADYWELAKLHLQRDLPALAVRTLEAALTRFRDDAQTHYLLAKAYHLAGRPLGKIEIRDLDQAIPGNIQGKWYVLEVDGDRPAHCQVCPANSAIYHLHKALVLGCDEPDIHLLNADIWFNANDYVRAREIYEMIEDAVPKALLPDYHYRFGKTLFWLDDLAGFQNHVEAASKLDPQRYKPKLLEAHTMLADRYCLRGNLEQYIRHLELAIEAAPRSAGLRYKLGNALHEAERRGEAAAHWQVVLQLEPFHPDRERLLELLNYQDLDSPSLPEQAETPNG